VKRAPALARLSRDHHEALVAALRLRRTTAGTCATAREDFMSFWQTAGARHFRVEEEVLLPGLAAWVDARHPLIARTLCEHVAIRARIRGLRVGAAVPEAELRALGEALTAHVRMEERELFALIEQTVPAAELDLLADAVEDG
jgi:hemerythrin-like domain-containing protein